MVNQVTEEDLSKLLQDLRQALRIASFSEIRKISDKIESVSRGLNPQSEMRGDHREVASEMVKIQSLITSSINGIRSAQRKVQLYGKPKAEFVTYSSTAKLTKS